MAREDGFVVTPNKLVGPPLELPTTGICVKDPKLNGYGFFRTRLVHLLDGLKGQYHVTDLVGLAVPDQLQFPLIFEQEKPVLLW